MKTTTFSACLLLALTACAPSRPPSRQDAMQLEQQMWARAGRELATLAAGPGSDGARVLLVRAGAKTSEGPAQDAMEKSLRDAIKPRELVAATLPNQPRTPDQVAALMPDLPVALEAGWLDGELKKHAPVGAVVSLAGEPTSGPASGVKWPPVVCFAPAAQGRLAALIRSGVVSGAVAQRHDAPKKGEDDWFSLRYTVLRKDNVEEWQGKGDRK